MTYKVQWKNDSMGWHNLPGYTFDDPDSAHQHARFRRDTALSLVRDSRATDPPAYRVVDERGHVRHA